MQANEKILFISHECDRTGAPIVLLTLLKELKEKWKLSFEVLVKKDGDLYRDFRNTAKTFRYQLKSPENPLKGMFVNRLLNPFLKWWIPKYLKNRTYHMIIANSVSSCELALAIGYKKAAKKILYVHELRMVAEQVIGLGKLKLMAHEFENFISVSNAVTEFLMNEVAVPEKKIKKVNEFIDLPVQLNEIINFRQIFGLKKNTFIVGSSGTMDWRKGFDLIPQIVKSVAEKNSNIHFVWIGSSVSQHTPKRIMQDANRYGVASNLHIIDSKPNPLDYFAGFDIFLLPSREDPFPLVCLENAALGKPIIHFKQSGGMDEFVNPDFGTGIQFFDLNALSNTIVSYANDPIMTKEKGIQAKEAVKKYNVKDSAKSFYQYLKSLNQS